MLTIRKFENKDYENVQYVCLNSDEPVVDENILEFIVITFCNYYLDHEPENCFVLDDDGKAVGYIISTENYDSYKEIFDKEYLPLTKKFGPDIYKWAETSTVLQNKYKADYPSHLHIDLLPEYQRQGWGGKLIQTLFDHLRSKGIKGVMLTTGKENIKGVSFYNKYGFEILETCGDDVAFGMKF